MKRVIFVTILSILFAQNVVAQSTDTFVRRQTNVDF